MERLTYWNEEYGCWSYRGPSGDAAARLAAYEDTGLEPEEINRVLDAYGRGHTLRTESAERLEIIRDIQTAHLRELVQAEKDGRLMVLPAKIVYELAWGAGPGCDLICPVGIDGAGLCDFCDHGKLGVHETVCTQELAKHFGETVFLTREEAEAALKERGADNG